MINIIIPFYNGKDLLVRALASIQAQTEKRAIITIVNDCGEDISDIIERSPLSIKQFFTEKNSGAGVARQIGIDYCNTDYLMFLDADDVLMPTAIKDINSLIQSKRPEILETVFIEERIDDSIPHGFNRTWLHGKVFKTDFLRDNDIRFHKTLRFNEDGAFCGIAFALSNNVERADKITYVWCNNKNSTVRGQHKDYYAERLYTFCQAREYIFEELKKRNKKEELIISEKDSLCTLYNMYLELYNYSPDNLISFNQEVKKYIAQIDYYNLIKDEDFLRRLGISFYEQCKNRPRYGPQIPHLTLFQYYDSLK